MSREGSASVLTAVRNDLRVVQGSLDASVEKIHGFMKQLLQSIKIDEDAAYRIIKAMIESAEEQASKTPAAPGSGPPQRIPRNFHRIWLTNPSLPVEPPERYLRQIAAEVDEYVANGWSYRIWVQKRGLLPKIVEIVGSANDNVEIAEIDTLFSDQGRWADVFHAFVNERKYPFAVDILRMKILDEYGGIYADIGARLKSVELAEIIVRNFDYALMFWETMFFQNSVLAMAEKSSVTQIFMRLAGNPYSFPKHLFAHLDGIVEGMAFSGLTTTAILLAQMHLDIDVLPLAPNGDLVKWEAEQSWYTNVGDGNGKFGNAFVPGSGPSYLKRDLLGSQPVDDLFCGCR